MNEWYNNTWSDVVKQLGSDIKTGLTLEKVEALKEGKPNDEVFQFKKISLSNIFLNEIKHLWVILSIIVIFSSVFYSKFLIAISILAVVIIDLYLIVSSKIKEQKKLIELEKLSPISCKVLRNGKIIRLAPDELVVGDIVYLDKNEIVPADLRIIESEELKVKENAITGEDYVVEKYETKIEDKEISLEAMRNIAFKSSTIIEGNGTGIVFATDGDTQIGKIILMLLNEQKRDNYFIKRVHKILGRLSIFFCILNVFAVIFASIILKNKGDVLSWSSIISLSGYIQIIIPIFYLSSKILNKIFKKDNINLNNILAFENLTSASLLCLDSTEGIYENNLEVRRVYTDNSLVDVLGEEPIELNNENIKRVISISLLCNDCKAENSSKLIGRTDLIEYALIKFGKNNNVDKYTLNRESRRLFQIPYDSEKRVSTTINKVEGKYRANVKGSVEGVLSKCTHIMKNGIEKEISEEDINNIKNIDFDMSSNCLSVIAVAYRNFNYEPSQAENIESNLVFVGLIGLSSNIKKGVKQAIGYCRRRGIKLAIFTEENLLTAASIAKKLGFESEDDVLSGVEIDNMNEDEFRRSIEKASIFSKTKPEHKYMIIKSFKEMGFKVASSIFRLSELPSLKLSNIGISITDNCSGIIKNLSDIWLKEGSILNIINLLIEGNKVIQVVNKIMMYIVSCMIGSSVFIFASLLMHSRLPLQEMQLLWLNVVIFMSGSIIILFQFKNEKYRFETVSIYKGLITGKNIKLIAVNSLMIILSSVTLAFIFKNDYEINGSFLNFCLLSITCLMSAFSFINDNKIRDVKSKLILCLNIVLIALSFLIEKNKNISIRGLEVLFLILIVNAVVILRRRIFKILIKFKRKIANFKKTTFNK